MSSCATSGRGPCQRLVAGPPHGWDEHPSASPVRGMYYTSMVLDALASNPEVWSKTVLFLMYDENDGWFDHVGTSVLLDRDARAST